MAHRKVVVESQIHASPASGETYLRASDFVCLLFFFLSVACVLLRLAALLLFYAESRGVNVWGYWLLIGPVSFLIWFRAKRVIYLTVANKH